MITALRNEINSFRLIQRENELCHFLSRNKNVFYPKCAFSISNYELKCVGSVYQPQQNCQKGLRDTRIARRFPFHLLISFQMKSETIYLKTNSVLKVNQFSIFVREICTMKHYVQLESQFFVYTQANIQNVVKMAVNGC